MNQRVLLDRLWAGGPGTRPQLSKDCGLSQPTVIAALDDLERAGLVRLSEKPVQALGRPAAAYEANASAGHVVGVDIGGAWIRILVADISGETLASANIRNTARSAPALVTLASRVVREATEQAGLTSTQITHTVIGSPGVLDANVGRVRYAANLPGWHRPGLAQALTDEIGASLTIDNDANLAAIGEQTYGAALGVDDFVYLHIGTGIGLGVGIDGHIYRGATGAAGEVGYLPIGDGAARNRSGRSPGRGMMEEVLAAAAVVRYAKAAGMEGRLTAQRVFAAAREDDRAARAAVGEIAKRLAQLLASICAFLDPELIVVGGGIGHNLDLLAPETNAALRDLTPMQPKLVAGALGVAAVSRGAVSRGISIAREEVFVTREERVG